MANLSQTGLKTLKKLTLNGNLCRDFNFTTMHKFTFEQKFRGVYLIEVEADTFEEARKEAENILPELEEYDDYDFDGIIYTKAYVDGDEIGHVDGETFELKDPSDLEKAGLK